MTQTREFVSVRLDADPDVLFTLHHIPDNPDRRLLVTFGPAGSGIATHGFGTAFARRKGIDSIYIAQRADTYYQALTLERFLQVVGPVAQGRPCFAYGGSLGGWCACYYGGAIDAQIMAFSPLNPGHPDFLTNGLGQPVLPYAHLDLMDLPRASRPPVIAHDPHRPGDDAFLKRFILPRYPDAVRYEVPFAGHNVLDRMRRAGSLSRFVTAVLEGRTPDRVEIITEGCPFWHQERARMFRLKRDYAAAEHELRAALAASRDKVTVTNMLLFMLDFRSPDQARDMIEELDLGANPALVVPALAARLDAAGLMPAQ